MMENTINKFKMNGQTLTIITPFDLISAVDVRGNTIYFVGYTDESGEVYNVPFSLVNGLRSYSNTSMNRHDQPRYGTTRFAPDLEMYSQGINGLQHKVEMAYDSPEYTKRKSPNSHLFSPREDVEDPPYVSSVRTLATTLMPNPHLDKELLTKQELQEVLLWALEVSNYDGWPLVDAPQDTSPNSALAKIAAYLATLVYGKNNYIGPEKTGDIGTATLEEAVTTVPALSEDDARARAHDIALAVTSSPAVDNILPTLGRLAQVARPLFNSDQARRYPEPNTDHLRAARLPVRGGATNKSLLKLAGDVEENPGPPKKYSPETAVEEAAIYQNPKLYLSKFNLVQASTDDYQRAYFAAGHPTMMRGARDEQTDLFYADDGISNYSGWTWANVANAANRVTYTGGKIFNFGIASDTAKTNEMPPGALGAALSGTLLAFNDLLALQRTATNTLDGNPELNIYTRTPRTDFGCFVPIVKSLLMEFQRAPLSGDWTLDWCDNIMVRRSATFTNTLAVFPNSDNLTNGPPAPILAWAINSRVLAGLLLGNVVAVPGGWPGLYNVNTAYIPISDEIEPDTLSYITLCHLEWPFSSNTHRPFVNTMNPAGFNQVLNPAAQGDYRNVNRIAGPRENVVYILASESNVPTIPLGDTTGALTNIPVWNDPNVPIAGTDIAQRIVNYDNLETSGRNRTVWSKDFIPAMSYLLRFADADDWVAACSMTSTILSTIGHFQRLKWNDTQANSGYITANGTNPVLAPQVNNVQSWDITTGNSLQQVQNWRQWYQVWNDRGMVARQSPEQPVNTPRDPGQIDAYLQDSPWLTKYGIYKKYFAKKTLEPDNVDSYFRAGPFSVYYLIRDATRLRAEMLHNLFQDRGIVNRDIFVRTPQVLNRQQQLWNAVDTMVTGYDKHLAGWNFYRPCLRQLVTALPLVPAGTPNMTGASLDWYFDSPVYLSNPLLSLHEETLGIYPTSATGILPSKVYESWKPNASGNLNMYGVITGGNTSISIQPTHENNGTHPINAKKLWAMVKTMNLNNPAPVTSFTNFFLLRQNSNARNPVFDRPVVTSTLTGYLRYVFDTVNQEVPFASTRHQIIVLPFYPRAIELTTGQQLAICATTVGVANSIAASINLQGLGSATYATIDLPGSGAYDILADYGGFGSDKEDAQPPEQPPKN